MEVRIVGKIDLKKQFKQLYGPSAREAMMVEVPEMNFLMIGGVGDPNKSQEFQEAIDALYSISYTLKFMLKKGKEALDFVVMPLEGFWWTDDMTQFSMDNKDIWKWTLMIAQPEQVTEELFKKALDQARKKKDSPALAKVRLQSFHEGLAAQIMHIGPYSAEGPTVEKLHGFIREKGYKLRGKHHEIYLSDPRRSTPERMKTVLRQPVE